MHQLTQELCVTPVAVHAYLLMHCTRTRPCIAPLCMVSSAPVR